MTLQHLKISTVKTLSRSVLLNTSEETHSALIQLSGINPPPYHLPHHNASGFPQPGICHSAFLSSCALPPFSGERFLFFTEIFSSREIVRKVSTCISISYKLWGVNNKNICPKTIDFFKIQPVLISVGNITSSSRCAGGKLLFRARFFSAIDCARCSNDARCRLFP